MRSGRTVALFLCVLAALSVAPADAQDTAESMTATLQARAEAPPQPAVERPELRDVPVPDRLFYMRSYDHVRCVRSIADVTGDGRDEVIAGIDESQADNIFCLDGASSGEATVVWTQHPISGVSNGSPYGDDSLVPISDLDGNGYPNILVGTAWGGRSAHNLDSLAGAILWTFDTYLEPDSGWVYSLAEMSDVTGDGVPEVAFGAGSFNDTVYLVDGASTAPGQATVAWKRQMADAVMSVRNLGDVNGDGDDDVLIGVGDFGEVVVCMSGGSVDPAGTILWQYPTGTGDNVWAVGVMPDITGDGINEALAVLWASDGSSIRCLNGATGALVWPSTQVYGAGMMVDILDDVTGDGHDEIIVSSSENAVIVLNGLTGGLVWKTTVGTLNYGYVWSARAIDDLNGDGFQDVVAGSFDTYAYAMDGTDGTVLWAYPTGNRVYSIYPVGDLNGDSAPEVVVGNQNPTNGAQFLEVVHVLSGRIAPDFTLAATPDTVDICAGDTAEFAVDIGSIGGFGDDVTLDATGYPAGSTASFSPNPVTPPGSSLLTIGNTGGGAGGSYGITISGTASGSPGHDVDVTLDVVVPPATPTLIAPPDGAVGQPLRPTFQWTPVTGAESYSFELDDDPAFGSPEISETGILASTFTPSADLDEETTYHWRVGSLNLCGPGTASPPFSFTTGSPLPFADGFEGGDTSAWSATVP